MSLLPPAEYIIESTGVPYATLTPLRPGSGLRQQLGKLHGPVIRARIWMAASKDGEAVHVEASIVRNGTETIRQFSTRAGSAVKPEVHVFHFDPYVTSPSDKLELEVAAVPNQANFVIFGIAKSETAFTQVTVNHAPLNFQGPLAYELVGQRSGLQAVISGAAEGSVRFYSAIVALAMAALLVLLGPKLAGPILRVVNRLGSGTVELDRRKWFFYPWLIAAYPILYFYSKNAFAFGAPEMILPILATWGIVAVVVLILRFAIGSMDRAALIAAIGSAIFLSFGHLQAALGGRADPRILLPVAVVLPLAAALWTWNRRVFAAKVGRYLNVVSVILVLAPVASVGGNLVDRYANPIESAGTVAAAKFLKASIPHPAIAELGRLPDIYYIVLDTYPRADAMLPGFDNSPFVEALDHRGFYVPVGAISNYPSTQLSVPSSLNFRYLSEFAGGGSEIAPALHRLTADHALGRTLRSLGYTYVHLNSGFSPTNNPSNADLVVDFTPEQVTYQGSMSSNPFAFMFWLPSSKRFVQELLPTTLLRPFLPPHPVSPDTPYFWDHPQRTLATFQFLKTVPVLPESTFTFAHIVKPHAPYTFDQYGNISYPEGWTNEHDSTVPASLYGQLLYVNELVLGLLDTLITESDAPPIIVISADHGAKGKDRHKILAAYHLPYGGNSMLYPSVSSVNSFRVVLDYYFGLNLGLLDDNIHLRPRDGNNFEFQESPITIRKN